MAERVDFYSERTNRMGRGKIIAKRGLRRVVVSWSVVMAKKGM